MVDSVGSIPYVGLLKEFVMINEKDLASYAETVVYLQDITKVMKCTVDQLSDKINKVVEDIFDLKLEKQKLLKQLAD